LQDFIQSEDSVTTLLDRSALTEECKQLYKGQVRDSIQALSHSHGRHI
jgi:hypothetical protein